MSYPESESTSSSSEHRLGWRCRSCKPLSRVQVSWSVIRSFCAVILTATAFASPAIAQQETIVNGVVVSAESDEPLAGASISVVGTSRGTLTDQEGRFVLQGVETAQLTLSVSMIGYRTTTVDASPGQAELRIALEASAVELDRIVVTGTAGGQAKRALGTSIATVNAADIVDKAPVNTIGELINGRAAGVMIINTTGMLGGGSRVRIRGANSFSLSGEPLVYIDGVRVNNDQSTGPTNQAFGSSSISRWNDLNPQDIESIEIIRGPAAATLYGTEASNGVVQIITKRGTAGDARFNLSIKQGANWFADPEGRLWTNYFDVDGDGSIDPASETIDMYDLEKSRGNEIWETGHVQQYDLSVSGGSDRVRYYLAGNLENSGGVDPDNQIKKWGTRANVSAAVSDELDVTGSIGYVTGRTDLGFEAGGGGSTWSTYYATPANLDTPHRGYYSYPPEGYEALFDSWQDLERVTLSFRVNHRPTSWFSHGLTVGRDYTREQDNELMNNDPTWLYFSDFADQGYKSADDRSTDYTTVDYGATVRAPIRAVEGLESSTSVGGQLYRYYHEYISAYGEGFPFPGLTSINATTQNRTNDEFSVENVTLGAYVQEQLAWRNRLFLTLALRADDNSAFGDEFDLVYYPKIDASWVISEEPFWNLGSLDELKLRAAYGRSGQQPNAFDAIPTFAPVTGPNDAPAVSPDSIGNPNLGPEVGEEIELGFDAGLLNDRVGVEFTYYNSRTRDAIIAREVSPSTGFSGSQFVNAGEIRNSGFELLVTGTAWRAERHGLDLGFNISTNDNEVVSLGDATDDDFLSDGSYIQHRIGHPAGSWFGPRVVSAELDENGIATDMSCDNGQGGTVDCGEAPDVYLGRTIPKVEGGFNATLTLFDRIQVFGQVDFKTGFSKLDGNYRVRCVLFNLCHENYFPGEYDPVMMAEIQSAGTYPGVMIDKADFAKLRELSVSYSVPSRLVSRLGASNARITLAGRNLLTWSDYIGLEPESTFNAGDRGGNYSLWEQNVLPQLAQFVASIDLSF